MRRAAAIAAAVLAAGALPLTAHADVYGYVDAQGMAHFSTVKLDARYQLFLRGGDRAFDAADLMTPGKLTGPPPAPPSPLVSALSRHPNLKKYEALLNRAAHEFELEPALLKAVMAVESGFNPGALSPKGAVGLMQVLPATAERYGLQGDRKKSLAQKLADPNTNIRLAARYLRDLRRLFPERQDLVLASYNAGEGAVQKYDNQVPPYPETRNYVKLVSEFYRLYQPAPTGRVRMTLPPPALSAATAPAPLPDPFAD